MTTENRKPKTENRCLTVIGGGLAGSEAAWQAARRGVRVRLYEMKPQKFSPAHQSPLLGELVCSNSLRASSRDSAVGLLKEEMRRLDSLIMAAALATRVPAGKALAVDRGEFAAFITRALEAEPLIEIVREEDITRTNLTVEEGLKMAVSAGSMSPQGLGDSMVAADLQDKLQEQKQQ